MKNICILFLFVIITYIIACSSPAANIPAKRVGYYIGIEATLQKRTLILQIENSGDINMWYNDTNNISKPPAKPTSPQNPFSVKAENIKGVDPSYSYQNEQGAGTLTFIGDKKVIVTFRKLVPDYYGFEETCTNQNP